MKKTYTSFLCTAMAAIVLLSSCSTNTVKTKEDNKGSAPEIENSEYITKTGIKFSAPGVLPIVDKPVTLSIFTAQGNAVEDISTNEATKLLEERTNVNIKWTVANSTDGAEKITLMLTSNAKLPDMFMTNVMSKEQINVYGSEGVFLSLNELIDKYGVNIKNQWIYNPEIESAMKSTEGDVFSVFGYGECYHCRYAQREWINQKWLDNLNLKIPTTTDEYYNVLKAFKEKDANGNGDPNDEIPSVAFIDGWNSTVDNFIMNSFEYNAGANDSYLKIENGVVESSLVTDGWKDGLNYLKKLYSNNLLDKECFMTTSEQMKVLFSDTKGNRVGAFPGGVVDHGTDAKFEYTFLPPLKGPSGLVQTPKYNFTLEPKFMLTKDCAIPEIAFRWADTLCFDQVALIEAGDYSWMEFEFGPENKFWAKGGPDEKGLDGGPALFKWLLPWGEPQNFHWMDTYSNFYRKAMKGSMAENKELEFDQEKILWQAAESYEKAAASKSLPIISYTAAESTEMTEIKTILNDYVKESISKFVTGISNTETDWNKYLNEVENIGVPRLIEITQIAYDRQYK